MRRAFLAILLIGGGLAVSASASPKLTPQQIQSLRALIHASLERTQAPGASFAIGWHGTLLWSEGFGYADLENRVRATPQTAYRTASIGKAMTATAVMQLAEAKKIDLDAPIQTYCPRFPEKPWPITVRHLLTHQSGIRHTEPATEDEETYNPRHYDAVSDAIAIFQADSLKFRPGDDFLYSTWGYVLLGCVIEGATGEAYRDFMRQDIFEPAGMRDTRDDDPRAIIPNRARGYVIENGVLRNSRWADMSSKLPAGGWVTTAPDLVRFVDSWMAGKFVSAPTRDLMLTPGKLRDGSTVDQYGLGWWIDDYHGLRAGFHGGGTPQVSGIVFFVPERNIALAGLFDLENIPASERLSLMKAMTDVVLGEPTPTRQ